MILGEPKPGALDDDIACNVQSLRDRVNALETTTQNDGANQTNTRIAFIDRFTPLTQDNGTGLGPAMPPLAVVNDAGEVVANPNVTWPEYRRIEFLLREYEVLAGRSGLARAKAALDLHDGMKRMWIERVLITHGIDPTNVALTRGQLAFIEQMVDDANVDQGYFSRWPDAETTEELAEAHPLRMAVPEDARKSLAAVKEWVETHDEGARRAEAAAAMLYIEQNITEKPRKGVLDYCNKEAGDPPERPVLKVVHDEDVVAAAVGGTPSLTLDADEVFVVAYSSTGVIQQRIVTPQRWAEFCGEQ